MNLSSKNDNELQSENILLVDSTFDLENIHDIIKEKNISIITFDYKSHKILEKKNIDHKLSDDYITDLDCKNIQEYVYKFSYWYSYEKFSNFLKYEKINIGRLYLDETLNFFVRFLKKFKEIESIFNSNTNKKFLANNELFNIIQFFTNLVKNIPQSKLNTYSFTHDKIRIDLKIGKFQKTIFVNKIFYLKLKNIIDSIIGNIIKTSPISNTSHNILFAEFNTERFEHLFLESHKSNSQIFFYGRRRPAFWNIKTLKTIINSKCKIITNKYLSQKINKKNESLYISNTYEQLSKLWNNDQFLDDYFIFEKYKIFKLIKPTLIELIEKNIPYIVHEIELVKTMFQNFKFDYSVIINESGFSEQIIASLSKSFDVKCIHLQEGFHPDSKGVVNNLISQGVFTHDADKLVVWGQIDQELSINHGNVPSNKIQIIGAPRYDDLFNFKNDCGQYIVLASSADPQPEEVEGLRIKKIQKYLDDILEISKIVSEFNENLVIKLHPSPTQLLDISKLAPKINPKITVVSKGEISSLLPSAKLLISVGLTSAIIEAMILKKPVILVPGIDYNWGKSSIENEHGCIISNLTQLKSNIKLILENKNYFIENNFFYTYLSKLISFNGNASLEFYKYLDDLSKTKDHTS